MVSATASRQSLKESAGKKRAENVIFSAVTCACFILFMSAMACVISAPMFHLSRADLLNALFSESARFAIKLSLICATLSTLIAGVVGMPIAYFLSRHKFRGQIVWDTLLDLPIVLPPPVVGVSLLIFFSQSVPSFFEEHIFRITYTPAAIVVAQLFIAAPFAVRSLKAAFDAIGHRYEDVARTLGASWPRSFLEIVLPLSRNGLVAGLIMTWSRAMAEFGAVLFFAGATRNYTSVMPTQIFLSFSVGNIQGAFALACVLLITSAATLLMFRRLGGRGYLW